jgi:hypothetical protein
VRVGIAAVVLAVCCGRAHATKYGEEPHFEVTSSNGKFLLAVDAQSGVHRIYATSDRKSPIWTFRRPTQLATFFISDDGATVAAVAWQFVRADDMDEPAVEFLNARGRFASHAHRELVAHPPRVRGSGPIRGTWREWLADTYLDEGQLVVVTTGPHAYRFDLATGRIVERAFRAPGLLLWAIGTAMLLAIPLLVYAAIRGARPGPEPAQAAGDLTSVGPDRRTVALAAPSPIVFALWLAMDFAGLPGIDARIIETLRPIAWVTGLLLSPVSIVGAALLPRHRRGLQLAAAIAVPVLLVAIRIAF